MRDLRLLAVHDLIINIASGALFLVRRDFIDVLITMVCALRWLVVDLTRGRAVFRSSVVRHDVLARVDRDVRLAFLRVLLRTREDRIAIYGLLVKFCRLAGAELWLLKLAHRSQLVVTRLHQRLLQLARRVDHDHLLARAAPLAHRADRPDSCIASAASLRCALIRVRACLPLRIVLVLLNR